MSDCLFCRIIRREVPSTIVFEDEQVLAFKDIFPQAPVHLLIVPKLHCDGLNDLNDEALAVVPRILEVAGKLAAESGVAESGWRLLANCGEHAGQTVFHLHFHLLGGKVMGGKLCQ